MFHKKNASFPEKGNEALYVEGGGIGYYSYPKYFMRIRALPESRSLAMLFSRI